MLGFESLSAFCQLLNHLIDGNHVEQFKSERDALQWAFCRIAGNNALPTVILAVRGKGPLRPSGTKFHDLGWNEFVFRVVRKYHE